MKYVKVKKPLFPIKESYAVNIIKPQEHIVKREYNIEHIRSEEKLWLNLRHHQGTCISYLGNKKLFEVISEWNFQEPLEQTHIYSNALKIQSINKSIPWAYVWESSVVLQITFEFNTVSSVAKNYQGSWKVFDCFAGRIPNHLANVLGYSKDEYSEIKYYRANDKTDDLPEEYALEGSKCTLRWLYSWLSEGNIEWDEI